MTLFGGWKYDVGFLPHKVTVFEHGDRGLQLYLRWRPGKTLDGRWQSAGAWKYQSLGLTFAELIAREFPKLTPARARKEAEAWALARAQDRYDRNRGTLVDAPDPTPVVVVETPRLTLRRSWELATDPDTGKYPAASLLPVREPGAKPVGGRAAKLAVPRHVRHVAVAVRQAMAVWGPDTAWEDLRVGDWRKLWRRRFKAVRAAAGDAAQPSTGLAAGIATVARVLALVEWLREEGHFKAIAMPPRRWKQKAAEDFAQKNTGGVVPKPRKPRYTTDEIRRILTAARAGEPRVALLVAIGAELRPGQVLRTTRPDLTLPVVDWAAPVGDPDETDYGVAVVHGVGHKEGEEVHLTRGQRREVDRALAGYLRDLEAAYQAGALATYPLFPGEKMGGGVATVARHATAPPLDDDNARRHFRRIEAAAGIARAKGRSFYGIRRGNVDEAVEQEVRPEVLKHLGGWSNEATPRDIYKDQASVRDRQRARTARQRIRGEPAE